MVSKAGQATFLVISAAIGLGQGTAIAQSISPGTDTNTRVTQTGNQFDIEGGVRSPDGTNLFHTFESFGLTQEQIANFLARPDLENILTRVTGGSASVIDGLLQVSGGDANLFLMNPAGIVFGDNARLNVGADFMATTAHGIGFANGWFSAVGSNDYGALFGNPTRLAVTTTGSLVNSGFLQVPDGHSLSLVGGTVINAGSLLAPEGQVVMLAMPNDGVLELGGDGYSLSLNIGAKVLDQPNSLNFSPLNLPQVLAGLDPSEATGLTLNPDGTVMLTRSGSQIPTEGGVAIASNTLSTSGSVGGTVQVLGDRIGLVDGVIDVSGTQDGGVALIGGDYQGNGIIPNAQLTYVAPDGQIMADSLNQGDGGQIIVWADGSTDFRGSISARGGERSGNGGFAEVSGAENLGFRGSVDLSSMNGISGELLLDPENIVITDAPDAEIINDDILASDRPGEDLTINITSLAGGDITLAANGDISIVTEDPANTLSVPTGEENLTLIANADGINGGDFIMSINDTLVFQGAGNGRTLQIFGDNVILGNINARSGGAFAASVFVEATGNITTANIDAYADLGSASNAGDITLISSGGTIDTRAGQLSVNAPIGNVGSIYLNAEGDITTARLDANPTVGNGISTSGLTIISKNGSINTSYASSLPDTQQRDGLEGITIGFNPEQTNRDGEPGAVRLVAQNGNITLSSVRAESTQPDGEIIFDSSSVFFSQPIDATTEDPNPDFANPRFPSGSISPLLENRISNSQITITGDLNGSNGDRNVPLEINPEDANTNIVIEGGIGNATPFQSIDITANELTVQESIRAEESITLNSLVVVNSENSVEISTNTGTIAFNQGINAGDTALTLTGDNLTLAGTVEGTSSLTLQPSSSNQTITLGANTGFSLAQAELNTLQNFESVTIGRTDGTGGITIADNLSLAVPIILEPGTGAIALNSNITSTDDLTLGNTILGNDVALTTTDGNLTFNGTVNSETDNTFDLTIATGTGDIIFNNTIGITTSLDDLTLNNTGMVTLPNRIKLNATLTQQNAISVDFAGTLTSSQGDIIFNSPITTNGGDITLETRNGEISTNAISSNGGDIILTATDGFTTGPLNSTRDGGGDGSIRLDPNGVLTINRSSSNGISIQGGNVTFLSDPNLSTNLRIDTNNGNVRFNDILTSSRNLTINSNNGTVQFNRMVTADDLTINAGSGNIRLQELATLETFTPITTGVLTIKNGLDLEGSLTFPNASRVRLGGDINIGQGDVTVNTPIQLVNSTRVTAESGAIVLTRSVRSNGNDGNGVSLTANDGPITTATITTTGPITFSTRNSNITTGNLTTIGDAISLTASGATTVIETGNLVTDAEIGGNVSVIAGLQITTGDINTSGTTGNGGNVLLDPSGDIEVGFINTQSEDAVGGNITATTGSFFRATNTFTTNPTDENQNGVLASLSSLGGVQGGNITITHDGGAQLTFFNIDNLTNNGTAAAIVSGTSDLPNIIPSGEAYLGPYTQFRAQGTIDLITTPVAIPNELDVEEIPEQLPPPEPNSSFDLEKYFTEQYEQYFSEWGTEIRSLESIQETLYQIEVETGIRSALLYAFFAPEEDLAQWNSARDIRLSHVRMEVWQEIYADLIAQEESFLRDLFNIDNTIPFERLAEQYAMTNPSNFPGYPRNPDDRLGLVLVLSNAVEYIDNVTLTRQEASQRLQVFRDEIFKHEQGRVNDYRPHAQQFYDWLLPDGIQTTLDKNGIEHLSFILDYELRGIPVAALHNPENRPIVETLSVGLMPSFSLTDTRYTPFEHSRLLAMGTDDFSQASPPLSPLPAVPFELGAIANLESANLWDDVLLFQDARFTPENLTEAHRNEVPEAIHLATHARFDRTNPGESYIYFANGMPVSLDEMRDWNLAQPPMNLMLLSACNTAMGNEQAELGFVGVAYQSRITSVLGSLWQVDDWATAALMTAFHNMLADPAFANPAPSGNTDVGDAMIKAIALQRVQQLLIAGNIYLEHTTQSDIYQMMWNPETGEESRIWPLSPDIDTAPLNSNIQNLDLSHPLYWSSFVVVGSPW